MGKRNQSQPVTPTVAPASPVDAPRSESVRTHGPQKPAPQLFGAELLRSVVSLSASATLDQVCEDAAHELLKLREPARRPRWLDRD